MPRPRLKETHPFITELRVMANQPNLAEYARHINCPERDVYTIADGKPENQTMLAHYRFAKAAGLDWEYYTIRYFNLDQEDE